MRRSVVFVALALTAVSCSSSDDPASDASTTAGSSAESTSAEGTEEALTEAVEGFGAALFSGAYTDTYDYLSADCQERWARGDWALEVASGMSVLASVLDLDESEMAELTVGEVVITDFTPESAQVAYETLDGDGATLLSASEDEPSAWVYEAGSWRLPNCEPVN